MTFLRILGRAMTTTAILVGGVAIAWALAPRWFPVDTPTAPQLLGVWIFVFGMALTVETLTGGFDERGDR